MRATLTAEIIDGIIALIPADWLLTDTAAFTDADDRRAAYVAYLTDRLATSHTFVEEALRARA
jgi:hypothetical protein